MWIFLPYRVHLCRKSCQMKPFMNLSRIISCVRFGASAATTRAGYTAARLVSCQLVSLEGGTSRVGHRAAARGSAHDLARSGTIWRPRGDLRMARMSVVRVPRVHTSNDEFHDVADALAS